VDDERRQADLKGGPMKSSRPTLYGSRHAVSAGHDLAAAAWIDALADYGTMSFGDVPSAAVHSPMPTTAIRDPIGQVCTSQTTDSAPTSCHTCTSPAHQPLPNQSMGAKPGRHKSNGRHYMLATV